MLMAAWVLSRSVMLVSVGLLVTIRSPCVEELWISELRRVSSPSAITTAVAPAPPYRI